MTTRIQKIKDDSFYKALFALVLPITIQGLVNNAVNSADVFMLGYVGQDALSAVSLANQLQFVITGFFWGITGGVSLMIAQYFGKGDLRSVQSVMGIGFKVSLLFTLAISLIAILLPAQVMVLFTDDATLISIGASYLRAIGITYLLQSVSQVYECAMRSMGRATVSTVISSVALLTNVLLNAVFIFGWLGMPRLGVLGVALATVIARALEVALCILDAAKSRFLHYEAALLFHSDPLLVKDFFRFSVPALFNDLSWTVAFSTYSIILGHLGSDVVAASAVATTIRDLCTVVCMSLGAAAVAIIGKEIGANDLAAARRDGRRHEVRDALRYDQYVVHRRAGRLPRRVRIQASGESRLFRALPRRVLQGPRRDRALPEI